MFRSFRGQQVLLCGADLSNPRHELAWDSCADRGRYHAFADAVTSRLRPALRRHAQGLLTPDVARRILGGLGGWV